MANAPPLLPRLTGRHIPNKSEVFSKNISKQKFDFDRICSGKITKKKIQYEIMSKQLEEEMKRINDGLVKTLDEIYKKEEEVVSSERIIIYTGNNIDSNMTQAISHIRESYPDSLIIVVR